MAHTWVTRYVETKCMCAQLFHTTRPHTHLFNQRWNRCADGICGVNIITTASRLDKHQHIGMYTAQLYAAVCDGRDCRTSHVRQKNLILDRFFSSGSKFFVKFRVRMRKTGRITPFFSENRADFLLLNP